MIRAASFRGQPLLLLAGVLVSWVGVRAALWESPVPVVERSAGAAFIPSSEAEPEGLSTQAVPGARPASPARRSAPESAPGWLERPLPAPLPAKPDWPKLSEAESADTRLAATSQQSVYAVVGHELLLLAGLSQMAIPPELLAYFQPGAGSGAAGSSREGAPSPAIPGAGAPAIPVPGAIVPATPQPGAPALMGPTPMGAGERAASRWSGDGWLLLRRGETSAVAGERPSYGRSQAGAVIRYQLAPSSGHRPQAYARASAALAGSREEEVAAGLSVRPLAGVPLRVAAEARYTQRSNDNEVRPAAYAVTELPTVSLPLATRGEAYLQGGYVGGDHDTAFIDGQARIVKPLLSREGTELSAGLATWGGAQRDAKRLDVGPSAQVSFRLGDARGRVAADYRVRIAGDAEPDSGPALTLSAGF